MKSTKQYKRYKKVKDFLLRSDFNGFTKNELFIMNFIKKGWGHDIAALSNMAEAIANLSVSNPKQKELYSTLISEVVKRAIHRKVSPYKKNIQNVPNLGKYGYYLEHLNIILGAYKKVTTNDQYQNLNERITIHLINNSMSYSNVHADLLPYVKMKWSADQAAIIYSAWLFDRNYGTELSVELKNKWLKYMSKYRIHKKTGLFKTEVLGTRKYSEEPRGCSLSYMIHYMGRFAPNIALQQWELYKKIMSKKVFGKMGFREYLPDYKGSWTPDSGPIISGIGIAATGLALNAASTVEDKVTFKKLESTMNPFYSVFSKAEFLPLINIMTKIGTDLLSSSIWLNAETKQKWFI